ncbi:hypothetical protein ACGFX4_16405 [Kitasatospora sp. NPDC048365]|uniref:hypothetical protein n=1 Tax=Kitasatospora sp. NPDC048365 TaxID=3364050 RepID=UPI00371A5D47
MPAPLLPRPNGRRPAAPVRRSAWVLALLAALAVMLSHGLHSETPAEHHAPVVHAASTHGHEAQKPTCGHDDRGHALAAAAPDGADGHDHGTHVCLAGHPPQGPVLPGPGHASAPPAPSAEPLSSAAGRAWKAPPRGGQGPPTGIPVLQV